MTETPSASTSTGPEPGDNDVREEPGTDTGAPPVDQPVQPTDPTNPNTPTETPTDPPANAGQVPGAPDLQPSLDHPNG